MVLNKVEKFISQYATLANERYLLPLALWVAATHTWDTFDCFPYLVVTAYVKRAGKTRLMELLQMIVAHGRTFSADSTASMFRSLEDENKPCIFIDEAEKLNQEQHPAREFLNKGYKRGQTITRVIGNEVVDFECYSPKCFVLIGDVYDTLRDRSIVVTMRRRTPIESANETKFRRAVVEPEADLLRSELDAAISLNKAAIDSAYAEMSALSFLNDRDEELWTPLFAIAKVLCPSRIPELTRYAVDIATEKTSKRRGFRELMEVEDDKADDMEAGIMLLRDMLTLTSGKKYITSLELIDQLKNIPTSPWRVFRGDGLTMQSAAILLSSMNIRPKHIRVKSGKATTKAISRGYLRSDLIAASKLVGF